MTYFGEMMHSILFCGDTFLLARNGEDPFACFTEMFKDKLVCLNLETSLKNEEEKEKNVCLSVDENALEMIPETAMVISLVNNHVFDSGDPSRFVELLKARKKIVIGPENPSQSHITLDGMAVDFFSAYFKLPRLRLSYSGSVTDKLEKMICASKAEHRVVNLHWGYEHTDVPAPFQRNLAHRLVDAGASIIIGHHPHVAQGWEIYRGVPIFYSLGNFNFWQFDTETTEKNRWGYMVKYEPINGKGEPIPYRVNENYQPVPARDQDKNELIKRIELLSKELNSVNFSDWFTTYYKKWYKREFKVWKERCRKTKSPELLLKFVIWLILPMQIWFCWRIITNLGKGSQVK